MKRDESRALDSIISSVHDPGTEKIRILQLAQERFGYLRKDHMEYLAERIGTSFQDLYGIATFYSLFNLSPPGRHTIFICEGTSCHVKGGKEVRRKLEETLGVRIRETTPDRRFTLKSVRCLGCCGLAPVIMIDDRTYGRVKTSHVPEILGQHE